MKHYYRCVEGDVICILVDEYILEQCEEKIDFVLNSFLTLPSYSFGDYNVHYFYIIQEKDKNKYSAENSYAMNNIDDDKWILELINDLDVFFTNVLKCTVLHGSCIKIDSKNILLLGERWSGKTTLTYFLTTSCDGEYVSDDCVYIVNKQYYGFGTPLPIRNMDNVNSQHKQHILTSVLDSDNVLRTLLLPPKTIESVLNIDIVLFPQYAPNDKSELIKISPSEAFRKIIKNVHSFSNMGKMYQDIVELSNNTRCFLMTYPDSQTAYNLLNDYVLKI